MIFPSVIGFLFLWSGEDCVILGMIITRELLLEKFRYFNELIFMNRLPEIPIELADVKSYVGLCCFKRRRKPSGGWLYSDFKLRFNTRINLTERELEDILIHEMIHYCIGWNQKTDSSPHGELFRAMMNKINTQWGRSITIRHTSAPSDKDSHYDTRARWHVIAVLNPRSQTEQPKHPAGEGKVYIKVLPRVMEKIINYYNAFIGDPRISEIELYLSNDPFFNRYPNSAALKAHECDEATVRNHLTNAHPLEIIDGKVREKNVKQRHSH